MGTRARVVGACVVVVLPAMLGCATQEVRLQMTREVQLIPPVISGLKIDPSGQIDARGQGRTVQVTLTGDPELEATFDLKGRLQGQEMRETEPGVYVGSFQVGPNDTGEVDVVGHLLHSPTGAKQDISRDAALVLITPDDKPHECAPGAATEFEEQLADLVVQFEFNRYELTPGAKEILANSRTILASHPDCTLHLHGYADEVGTEDYNMTLSALRAGEVAAFIEQSLEIPADRLDVRWHGESNPVDTSGKPEGMARNRRVEVHAFQAD